LVLFTDRFECRTRISQRSGWTNSSVTGSRRTWRQRVLATTNSGSVSRCVVTAQLLGARSWKRHHRSALYRSDILRLKQAGTRYLCF
jgi:hypothetical protein